MASGTFELNESGFYQAEETVSGNFNLRLEKDFAGPIRIDVKTGGDTFAKGPTSDEFTNDKVLYTMEEFFESPSIDRTIRIVCLTKGGTNKPTYELTEV